MQKEFIPYEQALELKKLGFEEPCFGAWAENELFIPEKQKPSVQSLSNNQCLSPLYQQAFRFFREKYNYNCFIVSSPTGRQFYYYREDMSDRRNDSEPEMTGKYNTYEEAENACLLKLIELAKK